VWGPAGKIGRQRREPGGPNHERNCFTCRSILNPLAASSTGASDESCTSWSETDRQPSCCRFSKNRASKNGDSFSDQRKRGANARGFALIENCKVCSRKSRSHEHGVWAGCCNHSGGRKQSLRPASRRALPPEAAGQALRRPATTSLLSSYERLTKLKSAVISAVVAAGVGRLS